MASVFAELFGAPINGEGLFSSLNAFRRKELDLKTVGNGDTGGKQGQSSTAEGGAATEREQQTKSSKRKREASQQDVGSSQGKRRGSVAEARKKDTEEKGETSTKQTGSGGTGVGEEEIDNGSQQIAGTLERGSREGASKASREEKRKKKKDGDAAVVLTADAQKTEGGSAKVTKGASRSKKKGQHSSLSSPSDIDVSAKDEGHVLVRSPKVNGAKVESDDVLELLALKRRAEAVRQKRSRIEEGEEAPIRHVVELEDALDKQPLKKKKVKKDDEDDEEKRGQEAAAKRQAAKERKRSEKDKLPRTIFVGNLPAAVKKKEVKKEFAKYGAVESVRLRSMALEESKLPRKAAVLAGKVSAVKDSVNAYIVFEDAGAAQKALSHNMQEYLGRHLRVDVATPARSVGAAPPVEYDRLLSVFVGNLPFDVKDEEVIAAFSGPSAPAELQGAVEAVRVVRDKSTGLGKGIAYVMFKSKAASKVAIASPISVRGRVVRLTRPGAKLKGRTKLTTSSGRPRSIAAASAGTQQHRQVAQEGGKRQKGRASWEGAHAKKADGKPGKGAGETTFASRGKSAAMGAKGKKVPLGAGEQPENRKRVAKRPAVAARKTKAGKLTVGTRSPEGSGKPGKKPVRQAKMGPAKKADKKKASKGTASFQVKGRKL